MGRGRVVINDVDIRLQKDEWWYLIEKYPTVAFNYKNFNGKLNDAASGYKIIYIAEPLTGMPEQWNIELLKQYQHVITYNEKFYNDYNKIIPMTLTQGCLFCNFYYNLNSFVNYKDRINELCVLNSLHNSGQEGDIYYLRKLIVNDFKEDKRVLPAVWSKTKWGEESYKGSIPYYHSHLKNLEKLSQYKFSLCFESIYHPYWSWGFVTERLFNSFKAKTIPIYYGCYNIEDLVPLELFIDYRNFGNNKELIDFLISISEEQYHEMTEKAYKWVQTCRIGNIEDLEKVICKQL